MEKTFQCGYCGKGYYNPLDRANCEIACAEELRKKQKQEKVNKLKKERENRLNEINALIKQRKEVDKDISKKIEAFKRDYHVVDSEEFVFDKFEDVIKGNIQVDNLYNLLRCLFV